MTCFLGFPQVGPEKRGGDKKRRGDREPGDAGQMEQGAAAGHLKKFFGVANYGKFYVL